jgi:DNA-binding transcriptional MerR regulator
MSGRSLLKVGELAERTGLSVRALHYYEEIGLLLPSHRTPSNHRLYTAEDVARLQRIRSLRQMGFTLERIADLLTDPSITPLKIVEDHLALVREQVVLQERLLGRLESLARTLRRDGDVDTDAFLNTIEEMTMWEKAFSQEQKDLVQARAGKLGVENVREIELGWLGILATLRAAMEKGVEPNSSEVQVLVTRMSELTRKFAGNDEAIQRILADAYHAGAGAAYGLDASLIAFMNRAAHK